MRLSYVNIIFVRAGMSELADEADSKSVGGNVVRVQVPPPALYNELLWDPLQYLQGFLCYRIGCRREKYGLRNYHIWI